MLFGRQRKPLVVVLSTTIDPAGATANNILSNQNCTVTAPSNPGQFVRSIASVTIGKRECAFTIVNNPTNMQFGIVDTTLALNGCGFNGISGSNLSASFTATNGQVLSGSSFSQIGNTGFTPVAGDVVRMRLDRSTTPGKVAFSLNGGTLSSFYTVNAALTHAVHVGVGLQGNSSSVTIDFDPPGKGAGYFGWF